MDPYISVVVTAYNRKRYLPDALRSLEAQTLDKSKFEVIVVKNFEDLTSDEIIRRNGWRWVYSDEKALGPFTLAGVEEARGDVIAFLDDDDMYLNNKLSVIYDKFKNLKDLIYLHHAFYVVDETGKIIGRHPVGIDKDLYIKNELKRDPRLKAPLTQAIFFKYDAIGYSSAIVVRREPVETYLKLLLKHVLLIPDRALFVASLVGNGDLLLLSEPLELRRLHGENISIKIDLYTRKRVRYGDGIDDKFFTAALSKVSPLSNIVRWIYLANLSEYMTFPKLGDEDQLPKLRPGRDELRSLLQLLNDKSFSDRQHLTQLLGVAINLLIASMPDKVKWRYIKLRYVLMSKGYPPP